MPGVIEHGRASEDAIRAELHETYAEIERLREFNRILVAKVNAQAERIQKLSDDHPPEFVSDE